MFRPARMKFISLVVDHSISNKFIAFLGENNLLELINYNTIRPTDKASSIDFSNFKTQINDILLQYELPLTALLNESGTYVSNFRSNQIENYLNNNSEIKKFFDNLINIKENLEKSLKNIKILENEINDLYQLSKEILVFENNDFDIDLLRKMRFFSFKSGKISKNDFKKLEKSLENIDYYIQVNYSTEKEIFFYMFVIKQDEHILERVLEKLSFKEIIFPESYNGTLKEVLDQIEIEIWSKREELIEEKEKVEKLKQQYKDQFKKAYILLKYLKMMQKAYDHTLVVDKLIYLYGWIPEKYIKVLQNFITQNKFEELVVFELEEAEEINKKFPQLGKIPTKFINNFLIRPFEILVTTYGYPKYNDIDPTPIVSIGFLLMFGIMFGDVGHGFVIALAGALLGFILNIKSEGAKNLGKIMFASGLSSIFFGFVFGSMFASEEIIKPLLFHPIEPEYINVLLGSAILLGIIYIVIGIILNIIQTIINKDYKNLIFGSHGIISFLFYLLIIITGLLTIKYNISINLYLVLAIAFILLGLLAGKEYVSKFFLRSQAEKEDGENSSIIQEIFELIELAMNYFTNTVSFVRIGAFAMSHAALGVAVFQLNVVFKEMLNTGFITDLINIIFGNILIILMEGMVVTIQSLRLQYYEFFSKFFEGDGRKFNPISIEKN